MTKNSSTTNCIDCYFKLSLVIIPLLVVFNNKGWLSAALIVLISILGLIVNKEKVEWLRWEKLFIGSFLAYFLMISISILWFGGDLRDLDTPSRFLLVIPIFLYVRKSEINPVWLLFGFVLTAISLGLNEILYKSLGDSKYLFNLLDHYHSGIISFIASIFGVTSLLLIHSSRNILINLLLVFSSIVSIYTSFISGGRGVWIAAFLTLMMFYFLNPLRWSFKYKFFIFSLFISVFTISFFSPQTGVQGRINDLVNNSTAWIDKGTVNSSTGQRFELWKTAFLIIQDNTFFGIGEGNFHTYKKTLIDEGKVVGNIINYNHPHSEYLATLVEQGFIGLIILIFLLVTPVLAMRNYINSATSLNIMSLVSLLLVISFHYIFYGIANGVFDHQSTTLFFAFFLTFGMGILRANLNIEQ